MEIQINIPRKIFGKLLWESRYRRTLPRAWSLIQDGRRRLIFISYLTLLPHDEAMLHIIANLLDLRKALFSALNPADIAAISEQLAWMRLEPSTIPILSTFQHKGITYALPKPDFVGATAYEFAIADDAYREWIENPDDPQPLTRLVATIARPQNTKHGQITGDVRHPLSTDSQTAEHDIEKRAMDFADLDFAIVIAVLRFFEGVKKQVHEFGTASGIFEKTDEDEETQNSKPKTQNLFGWWTAYRTVAKSQLKTEEQVWAMSLWRVLSIMIEEKTKADEAEKMIRQTETA